MADSKVTGLGENTTPAVTDLLHMIDDPSGTAAGQKMTIASLLTLAVTNVTIQVLTGSSTYTPTTGMKKVLVICQAGGGSGASVTGVDSYGGGGGGGGCAIKLLTAADIGASKTYVAGAASGVNADGNDSTFGTTLVVAGKGLKGTASADSTTLGTLGVGGAGGIGTTGDLLIAGTAGMPGIVYSTSLGVGGAGGSSFLGGGAISVATETAGVAGGAYGGGGSGGASSAGTDRAGGAGAAGVIYCIEFLQV